MITILLSKIVELLKELKTNIENIQPGGETDISYSTDEKKIGTWIDGSDLYQKTFFFDDLGWHQGTWINHFLDTFDDGLNIINFWGWFEYSDSTARYPISYYRSSSIYVVTTTSSNNSDLDILPNLGAVNYIEDLCVTIQYTKPEPEPENNEEV